MTWYEAVFETLGIARRRAPSDLDSDTLKDTVLAMSRSRIAAEQRNTPLELLEKPDCVPVMTETRLLKRHLVDALIKAQEELTGQQSEPSTAEKPGRCCPGGIVTSMDHEAAGGYQRHERGVYE